MAGQPDPKPEKRVRDPHMVRAKLASRPICRACKAAKATDGHHIIKRSQGGDDIPDNIVPLCHECHMAYHAAQLSATMRVTGQELYYVRKKLGRDAGEGYLDRHGYTYD